MLWLMDKPQDAPTLPARYYRQKAARARQAAEEATRSGCRARLAVSISWPMLLTELAKQQIRPRG